MEFKQLIAEFGRELEKNKQSRYKKGLKTEKTGRGKKRQPENT